MTGEESTDRQYNLVRKSSTPKRLSRLISEEKKVSEPFCRKGLKVFHLKPVIFKVCHEDLVFTWLRAEQFLLAKILSFPTFCVGISQQNQQSFSFLLLSLWHQFWKVCLVGKKNFSWWFSNVKSNSYWFYIRRQKILPCTFIPRYLMNIHHVSWQ